MQAATIGQRPIDAESASDQTSGLAPRGDLDVARAAEYLLLANLLARPPSAALLADLAALEGDASPLGMAHIGLAEAARTITAEAAVREYTALFIGVGRGDVLPYGSYYLTGFLHERPLARIRRDMARLGIARQDGVFEPEDHIASLFEVMAGLIRGDFGQPAGTADQFLRRHIAPWAPRLMNDVEAAPSARFYRAVAALARTWLAIEAEALQLPD